MTLYRSGLVILVLAVYCAQSDDAWSEDQEVFAPGYNAYCETLARGVSAWHNSITSIEGTAYAQIYLSQREIASLRESDAAGVVGKPPSTRYTRHGLCVCRFFLGPEKWFTELAEVVPCGSNPWGTVLRTSDGKALSEVSSSARCPISYSIRDGRKVILYNSGVGPWGTAEVRDFEDRHVGTGPARKIREALLLTAANAPLGEALLQLIHSTYSSTGTRRVAASEESRTTETKWWKLEAYFKSRHGSLIRYTVWVDPDRGYMPQAFESLIVDGQEHRRGMRYCRRVLAAKEVSDGIWLPEESVLHWYVYEPERKSNWYRLVRVRYEDLRINMDEPTFSMIPPLGSSVRDLHMGDLRYRQVGKLQQALEEFKKAEPLQANPDMDGPLTGNELSNVFWEE